jgi:hypothetical protein
MTMQHPIHPDDERLAALASSDPDATADSGLVEHVEGCARCGAVVADVRLLRSALAELPDLPPSRPLQLVPPVSAAPEASGGAFGWLRRLAAPAMAAGAGLALVGAIGFGGAALSGMASGAGAAPEINSADRGGEAPESDSTAPAYLEDPTAQPAPSAVDGDDRGEEAAPLVVVDFNTPGAWLVILGSGVALLVAGLVLRFAVQPRAG